MIVDSSAIVAILRDEPVASELAKALIAARSRLIATPTYLETCMVALSGKSPLAWSFVDQTLTRYEIQQIAFSNDAAKAAVEAFRRFGKGRGHPAQLNFGDCISYAVSKVEMMPLLFTGDDFRKTDVECAI
jgi:ribonuclease VapC